MPKNIFIVDDSPLLRRLVRDCLESQVEEIDCTEAVNGWDAVQRANEVKPDVVILDLCMPVMNGLEAAASLHSMLPKVPIILYTLHKDMVPEKQIQNSGIRAVVSKMDQIDVLLAEIIRYVGGAKTTSA